jgi:hypothetical protein
MYYVEIVPLEIHRKSVLKTNNANDDPTRQRVYMPRFHRVITLTMHANNMEKKKSKEEVIVLRIGVYCEKKTRISRRREHGF